ALVETIEGAVDVLTEFGTLSANPLPNGDPLRLLSSRVIKQVRANADPKMLQSNTRERRFSALSDGEWSRLRAVGTLKIRPIVFARGTAQLTQEGRAQLDPAVTHLTHYPNFRVSVLGHTGLRGDADVNRALSLQRAEAVTSYLRAEHGLSNNRLRATGLGSAQPLERYPGESARAYNYRLPRVELVLVSGGF
ncbi:MAG: OmpA family protein, partial [Gammaproteobacteria bacterium]|nr:OmpA family protein [Gammaproteobacteria bacterium]